jgi:hypothetical protein
LVSSFSLLAAVLGLAACGGGDDLLTVGEACSRISGPACDRAITCGQGPASDRQGCLDVFMRGCCKNAGNCGVKAKTQEASTQIEGYIDRCSTALMTWDCARYNQGESPAQCESVSGSGLRLRDEPMSRSPLATPFGSAARLGSGVGRAHRSF